jgi:polysaccharide export outer membrane protein
MPITRILLLAAALALAVVHATAQPAQGQQAGNGRPPESAPSVAVPEAPEYRISRGDKLRIEVYKDPFLSQSLQVRPDGRITLPLVGDMAAAGLTPLELRASIGTGLKEFVANPIVTVIVVEVVEPVVYVLGEVNQPGSIPIRGSLNVLQALAMAGGFKEFANTKDIRILRRSADGSRVESYPFKYRDAVKGGAEVVLLYEGDTVVVP